MSVAEMSSLSCTVETSAERPFVIKSASPSWFCTWGFEPSEAVSKPITILNGVGYDADAAASLMEQFNRAGTATMRCTNTTKDGRLLSHDAVLTKREDRIICVSSNFEAASPSLSALAQHYADACDADALDSACGTVSLIEAAPGACRAVSKALVATTLDGLVQHYQQECTNDALDASAGTVLLIERNENIFYFSPDMATPTEDDMWIWHQLDHTGETAPSPGIPRVSSTHEAEDDADEIQIAGSFHGLGVLPRAEAPIRVGVNGFGRIGRQVVRIVALNRSDTMALRHINATMDPEYMAYLLTHDTVHGKFPGTVQPVAKGTTVNGVVTSSTGLLINGAFVSISTTRNPEEIPWADAGVDYVCESTGAFLTAEKCAPHMKAGAKKVVISAPAKDDGVPVIVVGVNEHAYDRESMHVISNASCTTNGLAPLVKLIHEKFGIKQGLMTTVHATTASQLTVDGSSKKDWRAGRASSSNIIPASTGAAKAVAKCYPAMKGKLTGVAVRVPVVDVSMVDLTCELETDATYEEIKAEVKLASETYAKGVVGYTEDQVVSSDFIGETCSTVFDANAGVMLNPRFVKLISWYDNEWGYSTRLVDLMGIIAAKDRS